MVAALNLYLPFSFILITNEPLQLGIQTVNVHRMHVETQCVHLSVLIISMPIACDYKGKGKSRKKSIAK
jgi:hypothetical protein